MARGMRTATNYLFAWEALDGCPCSLATTLISWTFATWSKTHGHHALRPENDCGPRQQRSNGTLQHEYHIEAGMFPLE